MQLFVSWESRKIIRDIKTILSSFDHWSITHVKRDGNHLVDAISKKVSSGKRSVEEFSTSSLCIDSFLERHIEPSPI